MCSKLKPARAQTLLDSVRITKQKQQQQQQKTTNNEVRYHSDYSNKTMDLSATVLEKPVKI